jgi:hypothetical protein
VKDANSMSAVTPRNSDPVTDKPPRRRRIPISIWLFLAIIGLTTGWSAIRAYRQHAAIRATESVKGTVLLTRPTQPQWIRSLTGDGSINPLLDEIVSLNLADSDVTDSTLVHLKELSGLERLWLNRSAVTDAGLVNLASLTNLRELGLQGTRVTDRGLVHLSGMTKLEILFLSQTEVTDNGMQYLQGFTHLEKLSLENTDVTDAGLAQLSSFGGLKWLYVGESKVTAKGIAELRRVLPNLEIHN